jgi:hypothetical protein
MRISIEAARLEHVDELLKLYFMIYGHNYPISYGSDATSAAAAIKSDDCQWLVAIDKSHHNQVVGSVVFDMDRANKVGKVLGLVVHPDYRKKGIASRLTASGDNLVAANGPLNSMYTTTRTQCIGPQVIFLRLDYLPLGIFPNAHKIKRFETTTLLAKYKPGVLEKRVRNEKIPESFISLYEVTRKHYPGLEIPSPATLPERSIKKHSPWDADFEAIYAPNYVLARFRKQITDPAAQFYPFHLPNLLLADTSGKVEVFAYFNRMDGYCAFISCNQPMYALHEVFPALLEALRSLGISYVEVLIGADRFESLEVLLRAQFLPSALYPAMREVDGRTYDYVLMTRTMEPLDFRGMAIEKSFKPYVDHYVALWKKMHLDVLEVFDEYQ